MHDNIDHPIEVPTSTIPAPAPKKPTKKHKVTDWLHDHQLTIRGEKSLWIAVITQALMDALHRATTAESLYHKHEAIRWLSDNSRDFIDVCLNAGLDPDMVRRRAKRAISNPCAWRAAPGTGKRYHERRGYRERIKAKQTTETPTRPAVPESAIILYGPWRQ